MDKNGIRYKESVIETNAMGILAIAERNAILKVIPKAVIDSVYKEAFQCANGDLSDNAKLLIARDKAFEMFKNEYGASEEEILGCLGIKTKEAVKPDHIADLRGYYQSLKDKELTAEELFNRFEKPRGSKTETVIKQDDPKANEPEKMQI